MFKCLFSTPCISRYQADIIQTQTSPGWYYRLVESYRNTDGRVSHRPKLYVGFLEGLSIDQMNLIQKMLTQRCENANNLLFDLASPFKKKKSVVHKSELVELQIIEQLFFIRLAARCVKIMYCRGKQICCIAF